MSNPKQGAWIAVASADHVRRGRAKGFMQVCHGKRSPLRRIAAGDLVAYYSPTIAMGGKDRLQAFTAIGRVRDREPYRCEMEGGFEAWRRDVIWAPSREAPIKPLLDALDFTAGRPNWGYQLRFGLFAVTLSDLRLIAGAMEAILAEVV